MPKNTMDDLIVLLPGITGSVLSRESQDLWNLSARTLWSTAVSLGASIRSLVLKDDDLGADVAPDGVTATAVIEDAHLVPGLYKVDGYSLLPEALGEAFELFESGPDDDEAGNFLKFPYDWRRDVRASAGRLQRVIRRKLDLWRRKGGTRGSRVILIAHSMGGLVAQYYLEALEGWPDCRALITFGTPYRGSVQAVQYLVHGYKLLLLNLADTMKSFPSTYQLLPRYPMIATGSGAKPKRVADLAKELKLNTAGVEAHGALHRDLDDAWNRHKDDERYKTRGYLTIPVVGTRQPTLLSAAWDGLALTTSRALPVGQETLPSHGDGTVPQVSAIPLTQSDPRDFRGYFVAEQHSSLQNQSFVLGDLVERLKLLQAANLAAVRGELPPSMPPRPLSVEVDDLYAADETVVVRAQAPDIRPGAAPTLEARITPTAGGATTTVALEPVADAQASLAITGLEEGLYRVEVAAKGQDAALFLPVHTIFEVAGTATMGREPI